MFCTNKNVDKAKVNILSKHKRKSLKETTRVIV